MILMRPARTVSSKGIRVNIRASTTAAPWSQKASSAPFTKKMVKPTKSSFKPTGKKHVKAFKIKADMQSRRKLVKPSAGEPTRAPSRKRTFGNSLKQSINIMKPKVLTRHCRPLVLPLQRADPITPPPETQSKIEGTVTKCPKKRFKSKFDSNITGGFVTASENTAAGKTMFPGKNKAHFEGYVPTQSRPVTRRGKTSDHNKNDHVGGAPNSGKKPKNRSSAVFKYKLRTRKPRPMMRI